MFFKPLISLFSLLCLAGLPVQAQSLLGLNYPMGIPEHGVSSISQSLGGCGVAIENDFLGAFNNPANLGSTRRTTFSTGVGINLLNIADHGENTNHLNASLFAISLSIPVARFGTFGLSINPESNPSVRFRTIEQFNKTDIAGNDAEQALFLPDSVEMGILRTGNSLSWQIAWGYNLFRKVRIGAALKRYNFYQNTTELLRSGGTLSNRLIDSAWTRFHTYAFRGGIIVPVKRFSLGLSGEYYFMNDADMSRFIFGTRANDTLKTPDTYNLKPAPSIAFGGSWQINQQWLVAADAGIRLWDRYFDASQSTRTIDNTLTLSSGVQFIPAPTLLSPKIYEITQYRAGLRYSQLPGADASEFALTLAAGFPMQTDAGLIDVIIELARRTDPRFNEYHENIVGLKIGINAGRKWYKTESGSY